MNRSLLLFRYLITVLILFTLAWAQRAERAATSAESDSSPEIERLVKSFGGEWKVVETLEHSEFSPNGGARKGTARVSLGTGGTTVIEDYHSDGTAGRMDFIAIIWWDKDAKLYRFFTCASEPAEFCSLSASLRKTGPDREIAISARHNSIFCTAIDDLFPRLLMLLYDPRLPLCCTCSSARLL